MRRASQRSSQRTSASVWKMRESSTSSRAVSVGRVLKRGRVAAGLGVVLQRADGDRPLGMDDGADV